MIGVYRRVMTWVGRLRRRFWVGFLLEIVIAVATAVPPKFPESYDMVGSL